MRTKSLLLAAALGVAGAFSSSAQSTNVYSVNAVGYAQVAVPVGFSIIANPLNAPVNKLSVILTNVPSGTTVYRYNGTYTIATYGLDDFGVLAWDNDLTINPGEGFWIRNLSGAPFTTTFVGDVPQGSLTNTIPVGFSLRASIVPQSGQLNTVLQYPASVSDKVYFFRNGAYSISSYDLDDFGVPNWDNPPIPKVGEGFWVSTAAAKPWIRTFSANN